VAFNGAKIVTREEMIAAVKECAEKMGRVPSFPELQIATQITTERCGATLATIHACWKSADWSAREPASR